MEEPEFISQTAEPMTPQQKREWCRQQAEDATTKGATWHRWSEDNNVVLYEGWLVRPVDQGQPRFQYAATAR